MHGSWEARMNIIVAVSLLLLVGHELMTCWIRRILYFPTSIHCLPPIHGLKLKLRVLARSLPGRWGGGERSFPTRPTHSSRPERLETSGRTFCRNRATVTIEHATPANTFAGDSSARAVAPERVKVIKDHFGFSLWWAGHTVTHIGWLAHMHAYIHAAVASWDKTLLISKLIDPAREPMNR
jgi:hypothetical protein